MNFVKVPGKNKKHKVLMYALSTCAWCKMEKQFLKDSSVEYEYVDVDLCNKEDQEKIIGSIQRRGGVLSYPTLIIDDKNLISGFRKDEIQKALEI
ncbi:MAG: glutaredoxin family protein [Candidatus Bathyarchaeaceae archaeon]